MGYYDDKFGLHIGHSLECVTYGIGRNVAIECMDCNEVILDADNPEFLPQNTEMYYREHCNVVFSILREHVGHEMRIEKDGILHCKKCKKALDMGY